MDDLIDSLVFVNTGNMTKDVAVERLNIIKMLTRNNTTIFVTERLDN